MCERGPVVPSRYGVFNGYRTLPWRVSDSLFSDPADRLMYRKFRSSFFRSPTLSATLACSEKPVTPQRLATAIFFGNQRDAGKPKALQRNPCYPLAKSFIQRTSKITRSRREIVHCQNARLRDSGTLFCYVAIVSTFASALAGTLGFA